MTSTEVLVVGGGPAGLTAALLAARDGHQVTLVEASDRLGGMAGSIEVGGQRVDLGSHRLHPAATPPVRRLIDELLGTDLQTRVRNGRLHLADRWVGFPLRTLDLVRGLPPAVGMAIGLDLLRAGRRDAREDAASTYADVVAARLGPTVLRLFHGPYARKLWGVDPDALDGDLARRRIAIRGAGDVISKLRRSANPEGRTFLYPRLGYGQIVESMAAAAVDAGVDVRTGTAPTALRPDAHGAGHGVDVDLTADAPGDGRLRAGHVLWTAPATRLSAALGRPAPLVTHRGVVLVYLVVDQPRWLPYDAHYVADVDVPFVRLSEPKNYRDGPDPADRTVLCAEVPATAGDATWTADDRDLLDAVLEGIRRLGLPAPPIAAHEVVRLPSVYPLVLQGAREALGRHLADLEDPEATPGVTLLGRQGLVVADNLHHVIAMAQDAAACLRPGGGFDTARWTAARRRFDDFVVED